MCVRMVEKLKQLAEMPLFKNFITGAILLAGILVGLETYPHIVEQYHSLLHLADTIILGIFVLEIAVKMGAEGNKPWRYFTDAWNVFDFIIVAACLMPGAGQYAVVLRLLRLLRVLKLLRALPKLQILVAALLKSLPSMFYVMLLLMLIFYVYAVGATFVFGQSDPLYYGNLQLSMLTLFRVVTLEGWSELMYISMYGCDQYGYDGREALCTHPTQFPVIGPLFYVSFVLLATMVVLNLVIGVIINSMDEARKEADDIIQQQRNENLGVTERQSLEAELEDLSSQLGTMHERLAKLRERLSRLP
jgi:voltage-gated sodium channel